METLGAFLDDVTGYDPARECLAWAPHDVVTARMSRGELRAASRVAAKKLARLGVSKGTRVGLLCPNRLEWLPIAFGALRLGAVLVPFSTLWKREEIAYGLSHGDVQVLLLRPTFLKHDYVAHVNTIVPELAMAPAGELFAVAAPHLRRVVLLEGSAPGCERWDDVPADLSEAVLDAMERAVVPTDVATIFFTSGSTAQAKAVVHAHGALVTSGRRIAECLGIGRDDAWWGHMPLFWSGGFVIGALDTLAGGGRIVLQEQVDASSALTLLAAERCTIMAGWHQAGPLLDHPDFAKHHLYLKRGSYHVLADRLLGSDHLACGMYGMSETATCVTSARHDDPPAIRHDTFGRPLLGMTVKIRNPETGAAQPVGETGEILVQGPTLMVGYYKVPPAETFDADGFFKTGDLGYVDADGYLHFATRLKDVIKTAGVNVAAVEVEEALVRHAAVKAAYVVGLPDPTRGENIVAFVVCQPGAQPTEAELQAFCKADLASYKVPKHILFLAEHEIPRTGTGKVEKPALKRLAQESIRMVDTRRVPAPRPS